MCLVAIALRAHPDYLVLIVANRDEFHARPSLPAMRWTDAPDVRGGRDVSSGGSWLASDTRGRYALVTNIRRLPLRDGRSRGELVADFVRGDACGGNYVADLKDVAGSYRPFNLIAGDQGGAWFLNSERATPDSLAPGIHSLSNADLDTPWPKTRRLRDRLEDYCARGERDPAALWAALSDRTLAADAELPDTGIGLERERFLSSAFIAGETYGTRASTLFSIDACGNARFHERAFGPGGAALGESVLEWPVA